MFFLYLFIFVILTIALVPIMMVVFGKFEFRFNKPRKFWRGALAGVILAIIFVILIGNFGGLAM